MSVAPTGTVNRATRYPRSGTRQRTLRWARSTTPSRPASAPVTKKAPNIHVADNMPLSCITRLPARADPRQPAKLGQVVADACPRKKQLVATPWPDHAKPRRARPVCRFRRVRLGRPDEGRRAAAAGYVIDQWRNPEAIEIAQSDDDRRASGRSPMRCGIYRNRRTRRCG
jgi:hypothetical protein